MKIYIKTRFDVKFPKFENVLKDSYILYCPFPNDKDAEGKIKEIISRKLGVVVPKIEFISFGRNGEWIFDIKD